MLPAIAKRGAVWLLILVAVGGGIVCRAAEEAGAEPKDAAEKAEAAPKDAADRAGVAFFERKVRPVLVKYCYECHAADADEIGGGLRLDSRPATRQGGESGPSIVPGNPRDSLLIAAVEYRGLEMPPEKKLPDDVIRDLRRWVQMGAPDPRVDAVAMPEEPDEPEAAVELWSLQPVQRPAVPGVQRADWPRSDIDRFLLAQLETRGLAPVGDAEPLQLLRRIYFDLIGLPPSLEDIRAFEADEAEDRFERVVDRLLESERFGERWGRHWLDVVRYGESAGNSRDVLMPYAYRYRDYVIQALNQDMPYDRFLTEQLAGDLLEAASPEERQRLRVATGLLAIGSKSLNGGNLELDIADDQIDVVGKAVLGLTISCARCHDHKFDPIPTADYYALAGIFRSTETFYGGGTNRPKNVQDKLKVYLPLGENADEDAERVLQHARRKAELTKQRAAAAKQVKTLEAKLPKDWQERVEARKQQPKEAAEEKPENEAEEIGEEKTAEEKTGEEGKEAKQDEEAGESKDSKADRQLLAQVQRLREVRRKLRELQEQLQELDKQELPSLEFAVGVRDKPKASDYPIQLRGERNRNGDVVPRGYLSCVSLPVPSQVEDKRQSGRLELARWLTHPDHPLTARVIVNRVWQHLFGQGLVETVDNFGVNGLPPSHPELLDYLADRFIHEHHWSLKSLIRELVLTRAYRLSTEYVAANYEADPDNTLRWRMSRRRLEAEALRDAMLACGGNLRATPPEGSLVTAIGEGEVGRGINTKVLDQPFPHRSVYLPIIRGMIPEFLKLFDLPEPSNPQGQRATTNVPAQSLYLLNSPFVIEQAESLAERLAAEGADDASRLRQAYRICLTRPPTPDEQARGLEFFDRTAQQLGGSSESGEPKQRADGTPPRQAAWVLLCQSLMAGAEFRYLD